MPHRPPGRLALPSTVMRTMGLVRAANIIPVVTALQRGGAGVESVLKRAGVPAWARSNPEMVIGTQAVARLLSEGSRTVGIANLGLLAGERARIEDLGIYG